MNYRDVSFKTHQPRTVYDSGNGTMNHFWDANGNLAQVVDCNHNAARLHEWDEENRLRFVLGEKYAGYYGYDANGERVYKLVGTTSLNQVNGGYMDANVLFDACVLYPNPYMVVTKTGYTKHYYAGTERLATVIGGGGLGEIGNPVDRQHSQHDLDIISSFNSRYSDYDPFEHENNLSEPVGTVGIDGTSNPRLDYTCSPIVLTDLDVLTHQNILLEAIEQNAPTMTLEQNVYFYHGDHLGSANWITNAGGMPIQYIHYAPYGELIANQQTIGYDERFKFTGKERDWETGYDYFGARFYDYRKGFWNSVDPLADKYPGNTPYLYCGGNPIKYVDPDGRESVVSPEIQKDSKYKLILQYAQYLDKINKEAIHFFGHGDLKRNRIALDVSNNIYINTPEELNQYLLANSETWVEYTATGNFTILVLESCNMGAGDDSFAQQMSAQYPNVLVVAANNNIEVINSQTAKVGSLVTLTNDTKVVKQSPQDANIFFYNGERVNSMDPNTIPILTLKAQSKKYENQQHEND